MANEKNLKNFPKGVSGNPKGRPKKKYAEHISEIRQQGYEAPTRTEYFDMLGLLLTMEELDLKSFAGNKERPYWIRLIIIDLNNRQSRQKMMADYRDWLFGRAEQKTDITTNGESLNKLNDFSNLTDKELDTLEKLTNKLTDKGGKV